MTALATPRRGLLLAAAVVLLVSLGLPWDQTPLVPGYLLPGQLLTRVGPDGQLITDFLPGAYIPGVGGLELSGFETTARVTAAAGAVLLALAIRGRSRSLALVAVGVAVLGPFTTGSIGTGQLTYLLAVALAVAGSGISGRLPLPRR